MIANSIFQQCVEESDLGFAFTADLNFLTTLIMYYVKCPVIGIIYRTFHMLTPYTLHLVHTSFVRSHLDYTCIVWQLYLLKDI